jgi:hypothetical protein
MLLTKRTEKDLTEFLSYTMIHGFKIAKIRDILEDIHKIMVEPKELIEWNNQEGYMEDLTIYSYNSMMRIKINESYFLTDIVIISSNDIKKEVELSINDSMFSIPVEDIKTISIKGVSE